MKTVARLLPILALSTALAASPAGAQTRLLRFPDLHGDEVAFTYGGDLWIAPAAGGDARRLTAHPGLELFPKFSPDGQWIAFTGQYDGDEQVYVLPTRGGAPRQLTWYPAKGPLPDRWGYDNQVYDWTPDGEAVLFRSLRQGSSIAEGRLYTVPAAGGLPEPLPMPRAGAGDFSPDGSRVVYSPLFRDFRTWKRYQGGWAQDLYVFDLASHELTQVTDHPRSDRDPMWIGGKIYFSSDRDGKLNLYAWDLDSSATEQLTRHDEWDARWPSDDGAGRIVYELNGELRILELASGESAGVSIRVPDDGLWTRPTRVSVADLIEDYELSPKGERAVFAARGDLFSVPIEHGTVRNLTGSPGAHDREPDWSPDGRWIAFVSDASGEDEIWRVAHDGSAEPEQLTEGHAERLYEPEWSPDGKRIAFSDKSGRLYVLELASGAELQIADEARGQIGRYKWSPRGGHLTFILSHPTDMTSIHIWSVGEEASRQVTDDLYLEFSPAWGAGGDYLYFFADREYAPQISAIEWNYATDRETYLYAMALRPDVPHPFPPRSDEVTVDGEDDAEATEEDEAEPAAKRGKKAKKAAAAADESSEEAEEGYIAIDFDGLAGRITRVPIEADNYGGLNAIDGHLIYFRGAPFYYGRSADVETQALVFSLEDREVHVLGEGVGGYALSPDGKKILVRHGSSYTLVDLPKGTLDAGKAVSTAGLQADRLPREEWAQIFDEVWRRFRDFFYVDNMHGYDWQAIRERYRPWLEHVAHRADLNYLIGEMIAELSAGHAYIWGGDFEVPERPRVALLGADLELDAEAGRYRIARILPGHNGEDRYRSPLTEVGVAVEEGDYLLAIEGEALEAGDNPYRLLRHRANGALTLTVNGEPRLEGAREVEILPLTGESDLRYLDWVLANRRRVNEMTEGRVGYLHIPDMGASGLREFIKWFYPQIRKEGLVVDVRGNGGGNVSQMLIERLRRELLGTRFNRNEDTPSTYPNEVFYGHMVCLLNEDSGSDGDIFPYRFREAGLGPLIGKRSWGGVVGITSHGPLIDGGQVRVPEFATNAIDGRWIIEGHGVDPDIEVDNDPKSLLEGRDPQLERAVAEVLEAMAADPRRLPERPAPPVKTE